MARLKDFVLASRGSRVLRCLLLVVGFADGSLAANPGGPMNTVDHWIWFYEDFPRGRTYLHASADETIELRRAHNFEGPQEIGYYEAHFPAGSFEQLNALKLASGVDTAQGKARSASPGTMFAGVGETKDGKDSVRSFSLFDIPSSVQPLVSEARRIARSMMAHPRRVLRGDGAPEAPTFEATDYLRFDVKLRSVGTEPVKLGNPLAAHGRDSKSAELRLFVVLQSGAGMSSDGAELSSEITPQNAKLRNPKGSPVQEPWIVLQPGAELSLSLRRKVHASPGKYRARLDCRFWDHDDPLALNGCLTIDLGTFEVVRSAKPRSKLP